MTTPMTADDVLATIARHRDEHESMAMCDAYSAQEYPRLRDAHEAVAAVYAERDALLEIAEMTVRNLRHKAEQEGIEPSSLGRFERALYEKAVSALARSKGGAS